MDLVTVATLSLFGALAAGTLVGALVGSFSRFELGLGVGLLIPGIVALSFAGRCLLDYYAFTEAGPNRAFGTVISIEDRPVSEGGEVTQPVPVVRFTAPDQTSHTVFGPASGAFKVGDQVSVIYQSAAPQHSLVGNPAELRGGAIAMMLFGTFPLSVGLWFVHDFLTGARDERRAAAMLAAENPNSLLRRIPLGLNLLLVAGIVWIGVSPGELEQGFVEGFGIVATGLAAYAVWGIFVRASAGWSFGLLVLAVNFATWAFALHLLT